jgi:hypothetical protein
VNEYTLIGIILAVIGILKGKDIWDYLKHREDSKAKDREIERLQKELKKEKSSNTRLKKMLK